MFEMWLWRRVLGVKWTDRRSNEWVRAKIGVDEEHGLLSVVKARKIRKYGHWRRRPDSLVCRIMDGRMSGKNRVGRRIINWMDNISSWCGRVDSARTIAVERLRPP